MIPRRFLSAFVAALVFFVRALAYAADPAYTLEVDSDAPDVVSYDAVAARISSELGVPVAPEGTPSRAAIVIRYRDEPRVLRVRVEHAGGRVLEREVRAEGDAAEIQDETVLLAGNLARDEASELLDELAARKKPPPPPPEPPAAPEKRDDDMKLLPIGETEYQGRTVATFAFVYPLATNFRRPHVDTNLSLSILYGHVGRIDGFGLGMGVQHASRGLRGVDVGVLATIVQGRVSGGQVSAGANVATDDVVGAQAAPLFSFTGKDLRGAQLTAVVGMTLGHVTGAQISAVGSYAGGVDGVQAGTANVAGDVAGTQIAVVNVGRQVNGLQLGIVNVAYKGVKGAALGVVNVAPEVDGVAIGIATIAKDSVHPIAWASNLAPTNVGFKFTTKYVYSVAAIGFGTLEQAMSISHPTFTVGLGGHIPIAGGVDVEPEVVYSHLEIEGPENANRALHARATLGYSFASHLRLFAGGGPRVPLAFDTGSHAVRPEVLAGVQF